MPQYPFHLVDVFGQSPFTGNPLAVVALPEAEDTATLQRITRWLNLSETAFLLPTTTPDADYRVRIFTLDRELPFAGHPTVGAAWWLRERASLRFAAERKGWPLPHRRSCDLAPSTQTVWKRPAVCLA